MAEPRRSLGDAEGVTSSLELATELVPTVGRIVAPVQGSWLLQLCADAGEAGGSFRSARPPLPRLWVPPGEAHDPERSLVENNRRRRREMRRYCAANRLNRLGTLTYAGDGVRDWDRAVRDIGVFFRALRDALGGTPLAYAWVLEWHPEGHGLHVHFAVGRYVPRSIIVEAWPHGFVHIKLIGGLPVGSGALHEARAAGRYLAKYLGKETSGERPIGRHAFDTAQGFKPPIERIDGASYEHVYDAASERMGGEPSFVWRSLDDPNWDRPSSCFLSWDA